MKFIPENVLIDTYTSIFNKYLLQKHNNERCNAFDSFRNLIKDYLNKDWWCPFSNAQVIKNLNLQIPVFSDKIIDSCNTIITKQLTNFVLSKYYLVFINGHFIPKLSKIKNFSKECILNNIKEQLKITPDLVTYMNNLDNNSEINPFTALNQAMWEDGAILYISSKVKITDPIHILFYSQGTVTIHPRVLILMEQGSQATVIVEQLGQGYYLNSPITQIKIGNTANLEYYQIQNESSEALHFGGINLIQEKDSTVNLNIISHGSILSYLTIENSLKGQSSKCLVNSLSFLANTQSCNISIFVKHQGINTISRQLLKNVLKQKSYSKNFSNVYVCKNAEKTDSHQSLHNLLMSKHSVAVSSPNLEILSDDVKCSHGSSTGFLNLDAEFYLRTRGINTPQAQAMLAYAFANDIIECLTLSLRNRISNQLNKYLYM